MYICWLMYHCRFRRVSFHIHGKLCKYSVCACMSVCMYVCIYLYLVIYIHILFASRLDIQLGRMPGGPRQVVANAAGGDGCPKRAAVRSRFAAAYGHGAREGQARPREGAQRCAQHYKRKGNG